MVYGHTVSNMVCFYTLIQLFFPFYPLTSLQVRLFICSYLHVKAELLELCDLCELRLLTLIITH